MATWPAGSVCGRTWTWRFLTVEAAKNAMLANAWRFRRILKDWRPDVLVTCNWGAIEFALANIAPVARHLHVVDGFGPEERQTQIRRRVLGAAAGAGPDAFSAALAEPGADCP